MPEVFNTIGTAAGQRNISWFPALIFNPFVESILLAGIIVLSVKLRANRVSIIVGSLLLAAMHSMQNVLWGVTVFPLFLIQSCAFFYSYRSDFMRSYLVISLSHSMHNGFVLVGIFCAGKLT
jgi:hypothetical protein